MIRGFAVKAALTAMLLMCAAAQAETVAVQTPLQDWQQRRVALFQALNGKDKTKATAALDGALTGFEKDPVSLTPMEAMDLYGVFYVPREGAANMQNLLKAVAMQATLGWYDALRFADESGRAEIENNEGFFKRAFLMGGGDGIKQLMDLMENHPADAAKAVADGITLARQFRDHVDYDEHWPTGYGLTAAQCGLNQGKACPPPPALPQAKWGAAFDQAAAFVTQYYRKNN
ncbi:MAG TPA: hypothetical protein VM661_17690 [Candidatus Sulfotelmatobacter sp.]|nr:hypothetical protein [Candidatus Sulfotelmatobacter sp.]